MADELIPQSRADRISLRSLAEWSERLAEAPSTTIPADKAALVPAATRAIIAALAPATAKQMAVEVARLVQWARAFGIPIHDVSTATASYTMSLKHLPPDLLRKAFEAIQATHKYGMRLPLPREVSAIVSDEYTRRLRIKTGLYRASRAKVEAPPMTPEERQRQREVMELALKSFRRVPVQADDLKA